MTQDLQIILVSPGAHYPSHNWPITVALMQALRRKGQRVQAVIFSTGTEPVPPDLQGSVKSVFAGTPLPWRPHSPCKLQNRRFGAMISHFETIACLVKALRETRKHPSAVIHFLSGTYWMVALAALWFRRFRFVYSLYGPILQSPANGMKAWLRPYLKKLLQRAAATGRVDFTCENEFIRQPVAAVIGSHAHIFPYAIDDGEELPAQEDARRRLDLPLNEKIVLFFGTHRREKDYHTPLKGCLTLANPPFALFAGKVISANDPCQVVADCRYPKARTVDEFVPGEMVKYYFAAADAVVLPYEAGFARGSGVLIECCRYLRPMIATDAPFFSSFTSRYPCGVSYSSGDSASFAGALQRLLAGGASYQPALEKARHDHSWTVVAEQYAKLYHGVGRVPSWKEEGGG